VECGVSRNDLINGFLVGTVALAVAGAALAGRPPNVTSDTAPAATKADAPKIDGSVFHAQVLLDRAGFSPGVIDGLEGISFQEALRGFQTARGLAVTGKLDRETRLMLLRDPSPSTRILSVDASDARGPFIGNIPDEPAEQAEMERLDYRNLLEKIAEKFHTTPDTIVALNDPSTILRAGAVLRLPNVLPSSRSYPKAKPEIAQLLSDFNVDPYQPKAERVVVDKSDKVVRVYDEQEQLVAQFPATLGSDKDPLPLGTWKVNSVGFNPPFKYQPRLFWDVPDDEEPQLLPPGPNGPVGVVWIDLSRENIGIHGTNSPETIKRAESHGCVRLTNWDAARLTQMIHDGMEVIFQA
jgi:lipoprotein-anchoring transpeptidase ErfK/SrfK